MPSYDVVNLYNDVIKPVFAFVVVEARTVPGNRTFDDDCKVDTKQVPCDSFSPSPSMLHSAKITDV